MVPFLAAFEVGWISDYHHPSSPEILMVLIKCVGMVSCSFAPGPKFDTARCKEFGLHRHESDAHRPITGHLIPTAFDPRDPTGYQKSTHSRAPDSKKRHKPERAKQQKARKRARLPQPTDPQSVPERRVVDALPEEDELDWINRQWRSSWQGGANHQCQGVNEEDTGRWIWPHPRNPKNWRPPVPFSLWYDHWMIPVAMHTEEEKDVYVDIG